MKALALPFAAVICLLLAGCGPNSIHPLYTAEDAVVVPALEGTWVMVDKTGNSKDSPGEFVLHKSGDHAYTMTMADPESKEVQSYDVNFVRLGSQLYMDLLFSADTVNGEKHDLPLGAFATHVILKLNLTATISPTRRWTQTRSRNNPRQTACRWPLSTPSKAR